MWTGVVLRRGRRLVWSSFSINYSINVMDKSRSLQSFSKSFSSYKVHCWEQVKRNFERGKEVGSALSVILPCCKDLTIKQRWWSWDLAEQWHGTETPEKDLCLQTLSLQQKSNLPTIKISFICVTLVSVKWWDWSLEPRYPGALVHTCYPKLRSP